jgi:hypothetical protein
MINQHLNINLLQLSETTLSSPSVSIYTNQQIPDMSRYGGKTIVNQSYLKTVAVNPQNP